MYPQETGSDRELLKHIERQNRLLVEQNQLLRELVETATAARRSQRDGDGEMLTALRSSARSLAAIERMLATAVTQGLRVDADQQSAAATRRPGEEV